MSHVATRHKVGLPTAPSRAAPNRAVTGGSEPRHARDRVVDDQSIRTRTQPKSSGETSSAIGTAIQTCPANTLY